jgi:serine/threonine protein phosphatase PrpC
MTSEEAAADARAHTITRWLGTDAPMAGGPGLRTFQLPGQGRLLLCTDGFWNYAPTPEALAGAIHSGPAGASSLDLARHLTDFALNAGGHDNITVIIADLPERPRGAP